MTNERLRSHLAAKGLTPAELAQLVRVDPKTVERWIASDGRTPQRTHRWSVAAQLGVDEAYLWPSVLDEQRAKAVSTSELVALFPNRGDVPADLWQAMVERATESVDLLVYAGLFWFDGHPDLIAILKDRAAAGVRVRFTFGDPDSEVVAQRGADEGIDMAGRVRMALGIVSPLAGLPGIDIRLHETTLYTSIYRADTHLLVNTHTYGSPAAHSPVLQLERMPTGRLVEHYLQSYERVWEQSRPYG